MPSVPSVVSAIQGYQGFAGNHGVIIPLQQVPGIRYPAQWQKRLSAKGRPYMCWNGGMPAIQPELLECAVYLYLTEDHARQGKDAGGSGFIVGVPGTARPERYHLYAVSNWHVAIDGGFSVVRVNTQDDKFDVLDLEPDKWEAAPRPIDVAVAPIAISGKDFKYKFLTEDMFITEERIVEENIGEGDDVFMVGRFINHEGKQRNLPSVRFGNIAMMPREPMPHPDGPQESFAVEMRSIGGYSGSPVFVYILPYTPRPGTETGYGFKHNQWFLGIDWGHIISTEPVRTKTGHEHPDGLYVRENSGMIGVVPAWRLRELLHSDKLKRQRDAEERRVLEHEAKHGGAVYDVSSEPPTKADNPQHREDFNRLLDAAVPGNKSDR